MTEDLHDVAHRKLVAVLGPVKASAAMEGALASTGLARITTADELHRFAEALIAVGGFPGAVGGLLSMHAVMQGAGAGEG